MLFDISRYLIDKYFDMIWSITPSGDPPQMDLPKINFFSGLNLGASFFDISRYLTNKHFETVWRYLTPFPRYPRKKIFFEWFNLGCHFFDVSRYLRDKYFNIVWGYPPPLVPPKGPPTLSL